jgi:bacillithiol system protein YtxJ
MAIVQTAAEVTSAWETRFASRPVAVLYKHSPTCGLSAIALDEVQAFADVHPDVPVYLVDVFALRPLSNAVEQALGIRHESPQAIVFRGGEVVWHGSHRRVTRADLANATVVPEA